MGTLSTWSGRLGGRTSDARTHHVGVYKHTVEPTSHEEWLAERLLLAPAPPRVGENVVVDPRRPLWSLAHALGYATPNAIRWEVEHLPGYRLVTARDERGEWIFREVFREARDSLFQVYQAPTSERVQ